MYSYKTSGVCARTINFDIDDNGIITAVEFDGGCNGNQTGHLALGSGEACRRDHLDLEGHYLRQTPHELPDQLARALQEAIDALLDDRLDPQSII